jgi:hypothetical protein
MRNIFLTDMNIFCSEYLVSSSVSQRNFLGLAYICGLLVGIIYFTGSFDEGGKLREYVKEFIKI